MPILLNLLLFGPAHVAATRTARDLRKVEIFSPPYLFMGVRPAITGAPATAAYGGPATINTPGALSVTSVALMRPTAVTHHTAASVTEQPRRCVSD